MTQLLHLCLLFFAFTPGVKMLKYSTFEQNALGLRLGFGFVRWDGLVLVYSGFKVCIRFVELVGLFRVGLGWEFRVSFGFSAGLGV